MKNSKQELVNLWLWVNKINRNNHEKGNTLILAMGIGLVLVIITSMALMNSSKDKTNTTAGEFTKRTSAVTEAGVNSLIAQFTSNPNNRSLLLRTFDPDGLLGGTLDEWTDTTKDLELQYAVNSCAEANDVANNLTVITIDPSSGDVNRNEVAVGDAGTYKLLAYRYDNTSDQGQLWVQGTLANQSDSKSGLLVNFPVTIEPSLSSSSAPALMASDFNMQQSDGITSNIVCTDPSKCSYSCTDPNDPTTPTFADLKTSLGGVANSDITNIYNNGSTSIKVGSLVIPPIPPAPSGVTINTFNATSNITLPQSTDVMSTKDVNGQTKDVYYYQISNWDKSEILINTTKQVRIYISGSVVQSGNDDLRLSDSTKTPSLGQIRVYGGLSNGSPPTGGSQDWLLSGNACTMAFIHAPYANIGIDGGGNGCSDINLADAQGDATAASITDTVIKSPANTNIYGGIWAKTYNVIGNPSNSSVFYEQPGLMQTIASGMDGFPGFQQVNVNSITSWQRKEAK